ncbi:serine hydrolase domain-containing protein [Ornithinibacillus halotolerans]|uniref:Penicillin-binding protein n=1 Tax=Ornithinibacillus halotolerans TaxID=1274357 RepID=A0A916S5V6_9BACI|nr:serine hydrolase [Ornithinibacillus halotolerans]GGA84888.1 penicillin-binding protein [Ornithinibacillus halotolerans]
MFEQLDRKIEEVVKEIGFSGAISIQKGQETIYEAAFGYANRSDKLDNTIDTRFGIASGCKIFTAVGIGILVEQGKISFDSYLKDYLDIDFSSFSEDITVHHLLTHTSGIPDYFDESVMDDFADLWKVKPMYLIREPKDFLSMFQSNEMMFPPGRMFHYNNAAFIVLGLLIEQISGKKFTDFVEEYIFRKSGMTDSGYFSLDELPSNTALGYIESDVVGTWKTNIYSIPVKGGPDGGAFITIRDMQKFWNALCNHSLLSSEITEKLLTPYVESDEDEFYGYGIWIEKKGNNITKHHVMGYDPGVSFHSAIYNSGIKVVITSNESAGAYDILLAIEGELS